MSHILKLQSLGRNDTVEPAYSSWSIFGCASSVSASICVHVD